MTLTEITPSTTAAACCALFLLYKISTIGRRESHLPPGPPTLPLVGNLLGLSASHAQYQYAQWAKAYGEIFSLKIAHQTIIVLSSPMAVKEIAERQSAITSDRPPWFLATQVCCGLQLAVCRYNDNWRRMRRGAHEILTPRACARYLPIQHAEAAQLMFDLLSEPSKFIFSARRYSVSAILSIVYGKRAPQFESPTITHFYDAIHSQLALCDPAAYPLLELLPVTQKLPKILAPWLKHCERVKTALHNLYFGLLKEAENRRRTGDLNECWMETLLERANEWGLNEHMIGHLGGTLLEGAGDTTSGFLLSFILLMAAHPEAQKKAQEEIDQVIGNDRTPTHQDVEQLPYVRAIIAEVFRMRPLTPLLVPHSTTSDLFYQGYRIPSETTVIVNAWGILHDEQYFEDPDYFRPERYLQHKFGLRKEAVEVEKVWKEDLVFGVGRRICPGMNLAKDSLAISVTNLLWGFNFSNATDPVTGRTMTPDILNYDSGLIACPKPYACSINPRSKKHAELIRVQYENVTDTFLPFEHDLPEADQEFVARQRSKEL